MTKLELLTKLINTPIEELSEIEQDVLCDSLPCRKCIVCNPDKSCNLSHKECAKKIQQTWLKDIELE